MISKLDARSLKDIGGHSTVENVKNALKSWWNSIPNKGVGFCTFGDSSGYVFTGGNFMAIGYRSGAYGMIYVFSYWASIPIKYIRFDNGNMVDPVSI